MISAGAGVTAQAATASTSSSRLSYSLKATPNGEVGSPPDCGPANDGEVWYDGDGNYFKCGKLNGTWGWYLMVGCDSSGAAANAKPAAVTVKSKAAEMSPASC